MAMAHSQDTVVKYVKEHPVDDAIAGSLKPVLEIRGIGKSFPGVTALDDVSFACLPGEVHALVGENGAGKSTLLKILSGAYRPDRGTLLLRGQEVHFVHPREAIKAGLSIIYQEFNLLPDPTVAQSSFL